MAIGNFSPQGNPAPTAEINMTPLVDVMLVLLIIFIITAPLLTHSIKIDLPQASSAPHQEKPQTVQVSITGDNRVLIGNEVIDASAQESHFRRAVARDPQVELHLKADRATRYEIIAETLSAARRAGVARIGFVTQPSP